MLELDWFMTLYLKDWCKARGEFLLHSCPCISIQVAEKRCIHKPSKGSRGPLEEIFRQLGIKPLVSGTFAEMSSNVKGFVETSVEYGVGHLGVSMAAMTPK